MLKDFQQFVPSAYCLACRGCCIFQDADSIWGPHVAPNEAIAIMAQGAASELSVDRKYILTEPAGAAHRCALLGSQDHHCRLYQDRPFECRLYPFVLSWEQQRLRLYAHLACPFIIDKFHSAEGEAYLEYLRAYFSRPEVLEFLGSHLDIFPDYSSAVDQIEICFDVMGRDLLTRQGEVSSWLSHRMNALSVRSFVSLFAWKDFFTYRFEEIGDNLCVFADQPIGTFLYWPPLGGSVAPSVIETCFAKMAQHNKGGSLTRIENVSREDLVLFDPARYDIIRQGQEYLYFRQDIVDLKGDDYKARRHDINKFERLYKPLWRAFSAADIDACAQLFDRWLDKRHAQHEDDTYRYMLQDNRVVHRLLLQHAAALGLVGRVVEVGGRIVAYTFGHALRDDVFCDMLEVVDPDLEGLSAYVFRAFCADEALSGFRFINAMDDFGMPDVKKAKLSYRPAILEPIYAVTEKRNV